MENINAILISRSFYFWKKIARQTLNFTHEKMVIFLNLLRFPISCGYLGGCS